LAYPEHFPDAAQADFFYSDYNDLLQKVKAQLKNIKKIRQEHLGSLIAGYDWTQMASVYDARLNNL
jgi:hypothetical protein